MTKQQIKDALLICANEAVLCDECPYDGYSDDMNCKSKLMLDAAVAIEPECAVFDKVEEYENCTVQVLVNTKTGDVSVGWRKNKNEQ